MQALLLNLHLFVQISSEVLIIQSIANISLNKYRIVWLCFDTGPHEEWPNGLDIPFDWPKLKGRWFCRLWWLWHWFFYAPNPLPPSPVNRHFSQANLDDFSSPEASPRVVRQSSFSTNPRPNTSSSMYCSDENLTDTVCCSFYDTVIWQATLLAKYCTEGQSAKNAATHFFHSNGHVQPWSVVWK